MNGGWTEYVLLWTFFKDSFETYKTFPWCIITEFECKLDVGNHKLVGYVFRIGFFKLFDNDDKK